MATIILCIILLYQVLFTYIKNYKCIFSGCEGMKVMAAVPATGRTYDTFFHVCIKASCTTNK
jgi:hypothetical protein